MNVPPTVIKETMPSWRDFKHWPVFVIGHLDPHNSHQSLLWEQIQKPERFRKENKGEQNEAYHLIRFLRVLL